ncbi:MAG: ABC transporter substrate-binding protein [Bacillota bacterium]
MRQRIAMNKTSLRLILALILMLSLLYGGCSGNKKQETVPAASSETDNIFVTDSAGRVVKVPADVQRIGCLYAISGHVVAMLGKTDNIVAVVAGLKRDRLLTQMYPEIKSALVPISSEDINVEELLKAKPDVIFINRSTLSNDIKIKELEKSNIPSLVVDYTNIKEQQDAIAMIGQVVGASDRAKKYNQYYQQIIDLVQSRVADIPMQDRVTVFHSVNEATRTDSKNTLPADWMQAAGVIDVSVNAGLRLVDNAYYASLEQIMLWNPDAIIANEDGVVDYIMGNKQWSSLRAVKNKKVFQMPNGISRWGHPGSMETPLAILWTAKNMYPDLFRDIDMVAETKKYYEEFFNYKLTDELAKQVLSGKGMRLPK